MASLKISELNELTNVESTDLIPIVDVSTNETKKVTSANLIKGSYSTNEVKTNNTWIDGKPIYRKVLTIPSLTKATMTTSIGGDRLLLPGSTTVSSGISNMGFLINMYGSIYNNNNQMPAMFPLNFDYISYVYEKIVNNDTIYISTSSYENVFWCYYSIEDSALKIRTTSMNSTNDWVGYVVLEYTKTTD